MAPPAVERLKNWGSQINQRLEILPNTKEEALKRAEIASLVGYASGVIGIITIVKAERLPELLNISRLCFIPGAGGAIDMVAMLVYGGRLRREEQEATKEKEEP